MTIENLFFQLLQVAIGTRKKLDRQPTSREWALLFDMSKKQALTAIAFTGVTKLNPGSDYCASLGIDEMTYLKWLGLTAKVAQRNKQLNEECAKVCVEMAHDGMQCCVLKGQSNLVNYPKELRECRTPGDIDLWTLPHPEGIPIVVASGNSAGYVNYTGISGVVEYAQMIRRIRGQKPITKDRVLYYHVEMDTDSGIEVELHYRPSFLCSPLRNWRLQRWFRENEPWGVCDAKIDGHTFPILPVSTNAVYQLLHIYKHLFEEGIGLRQLLDYYFVLRALHVEQGSLADRTESMAQWAEGMGVAVKSNEEIMHTLSRFGMKKFAGAVMYVLAQVFEPREDIKTKTIKTPSSIADSMNLSLEESSVASENKLSASTAISSNGILIDATIADGKKQSINPQPSTINLHPWMICEPDEKEGKFLLNEIMQAGNFGKYDARITHSTSQMGHAWEKLKHNFRLIRHYPEEVLCEPFFRVYHYFWRKLELWRY